MKKIIEVDCTHMAPKQFSVAICGCGSIGAIKQDVYDSPTTDAVLTHAHAFSKHPDIHKSILFIDNDIEKAVQAAVKWTKESFPTSAYISYDNWKARKLYTDIVVVATPTKTHKEVLFETLTHQPKLVVAEKPFCSNLKEAQEVHDRYAVAGIPILIDFIRRFDPIAADVFDELRAGAYGEIYAARCVYGRGLRRDGCHAVDLFLHVFGIPTGLSYNHKGIVDHLVDDPSYNVKLEFETCPEVHLIATDSRKWGAFEIEFITEKGIIRFYDWGKRIAWLKPEIEETFGQYRALSPHPVYMETGLHKALLYMADNCVHHLKDQSPLLCTSEDAITVHKVLEHIKGK